MSEYQREWRARNPDYHRRWREANREKERERRRRWRAANRDKVRAEKRDYGRRHRAQRVAYNRAWREANPAKVAEQNARRRERWEAAVPVAPLPSLHLGHELFDTARQLVPGGTGDEGGLYWPLNDDLRSEAVLAALEGRDPVEAVRAYRSRESAWHAIAQPIAEWLL